MTKTKLPSLEQWVAYFREQAQCGTSGCVYNPMHENATIILGEAELLLADWLRVGKTTPEIEERCSNLQKMILDHEKIKYELGADEPLYQLLELVSSIDVGTIPDTSQN